MKFNRRKRDKAYREKKHQFRRQYKRFRVNGVCRNGLSPYVFYVVLNTERKLDQGTAAAAIAKGVLLLYNKLDADNVRCHYLDNWFRSGRIVVLKGYDHKHLKYLQQQLKLLSCETQTVCHTWGRNKGSKGVVVLTVFGHKEDLGEVFEGLSYLR
ncbi:uncharacterized protein LOC143181741 [Calliopsis andreniformis]|uniref:uncharacterized protein LOC143181741 n=1 Tax=Calliopsis andreniformis TaxID=337506 RepID=UPI003FCE0A3B